MAILEAVRSRSVEAMVWVTTLLAAASPALAEPVIVASATSISFPVTVEALGTVRANEAVEIRAQISERVTAIRFSEGGQVEAGDVLVELDATRARADVAAARAAMVESEAQLRRAAQLRDARSLSQAEYDARLAERDARRAALAVAEAALEDTTVRAPFEGRVGLRRVSVGSLVDSGTIITTLDDTDPVKIDFDVPETLLAHIASGAAIEVRSAAWDGVVFDGQVEAVDTRVDPISRDLTVRGILPNPRGRLRPGMFVRVELLREDVEALVVPEQAIVPEQSRQFVLVLDDERRVEKRAVRTGRRRPGLVEILSGLAPGERVVAEGTQRARPGAVVEIVGEIRVDDIAGDGQTPAGGSGGAPAGAEAGRDASGEAGDAVAEDGA
jgi:membrane fusion protein (multidrug efflux system)